LADPPVGAGGARRARRRSQGAAHPRRPPRRLFGLGLELRGGPAAGGPDRTDPPVPGAGVRTSLLQCAQPPPRPRAARAARRRRLLHVALTRARDALYVYFPLRYYRRPRGLDDAHAYAQLSRFIPESVLDLFDRRGPSEAEPGEAEPAAAALGSGRARVEGFLA